MLVVNISEKLLISISNAIPRKMKLRKVFKMCEDNIVDLNHKIDDIRQKTETLLEEMESLLEECKNSIKDSRQVVEYA